LNAERLHAIAKALRTDLTATDVAADVQRLADELNLSVTEPQNPAHAQAVATLRNQLAERLAASKTNEFSDAWHLELEELGVADDFGEPLSERIEEIFMRNEITQSVAASELEQIAARLSSITANLDALIAGLSGFNVGAEELAPGEFEVGFLIPRSAVKNQFENLGNEFVELDRLLGPIMELTGENRPDLQVRSISSSGFQVFLIAYPDLALKLSQILVNLLSSYDKIRNMRKTVEDLEASGTVPPDVIEPLVRHANDSMKIDIDVLAQKMIEEAADLVPEGRRAELTMDVKRSLLKMADRIDEQYSIEVRSFVVPEGVDENMPREEWPVDVAPEAIRAAAQITARQPQMRTMNLTGRRILELSTGGEEDEAQDMPDNVEPPEDGEPPVV
jgi:hypothetical protein